MPVLKRWDGTQWVPVGPETGDMYALLTGAAFTGPVSVASSFTHYGTGTASHRGLVHGVGTDRHYVAPRNTDNTAWAWGWEYGFDWAKERWYFDTGIDVGGGTPARPALAFNSDLDTGIYGGGDVLSVSLGGAQNYLFSTSRFGPPNVAGFDGTRDLGLSSARWNDVHIAGFVRPQANTPSTVNTDYNKWSKVATLTIGYRYHDVDFEVTATTNGSGSSEGQYARVQVRLKQQAALGSAPYGSVLVRDSHVFHPTDFRLVVTENSASRTVAELYVLARRTYESISLTATSVNPNVNVSSGSVEFHKGSPFVTPIPAGTGLTFEGRDPIPPWNHIGTIDASGLASATVGNIRWSGISHHYTRFKIVAPEYTFDSTGNSHLYVRLNGDAGANYSSKPNYATSAAWAGTYASGITIAYAAYSYLYGGTGRANMTEIDIWNNGRMSIIRSRHQCHTGLTTYPYINDIFNGWNNGASIHTIDVFTSLAATWLTGAKFHLYGMVE